MEHCCVTMMKCFQSGGFNVDISGGLNLQRVVRCLVLRSVGEINTNAALDALRMTTDRLQHGLLHKFAVKMNTVQTCAYVSNKYHEFSWG